ncbi:hypothetical protein FRC03_006837 [Tulasnella sp. 419]|nr:hypothetical protein FRC02_009366 [Tulasnella sp. 418]KAG8960261.1 hypothetical protein FRC03_006837 [Tulasnella sp. 419]
MTATLIGTGDGVAFDLTDRFDITDLNIGKGSYADVSRGILSRDDGKSVEIAIKTFRYRGSTDSSDSKKLFTKKLVHEVNVWKRLDHPNVAPLLGFSNAVDSPPSLITLWYPGGDVVAYLKSFPEADRRQILHDLSCGLAYLHSLNIVHGDIKPDNALVDINGRASWSDFGLAHFIEGAAGYIGDTSSNTFRSGTFRFQSPEHMKDERNGKRKTTMMDIWAFGCTMAQVMSGQLPYRHCTTVYHVCVEVIEGNLPMDIVFHMSLDPSQKDLWIIVGQQAAGPFFCWLPAGSVTWEQ